MRTFLAGILVLLLGVATARADDPWSAWGDNFDAVMSDCVKAAQPDCLAKAFAARERPPVGDDVADDLYRDLRTAEVLLHQKDASDAMYKLYGIDSAAYLGTGYSVPLVGPGAKDYAYARQREYFVPNLCAAALDPAVCPKPDPRVWAWQLNAKTLALWAAKPIDAFFRAHWPKIATRLFAQRYAVTAPAPAPNLPPLVVRFGSLPPGIYKGNVGRPGARRVFFADFEQVRGKTLRDAVIATGAQGLIASPAASNTFFIWVYAPGADSQAALASWKELFKLLSQQAP